MPLKPITRQEQLLNAVASGEAANLEPITREEMFLAKLGGADVKIPTPITRKEQFLQKAIEGGGTPGGGGGGSTDEGWIGDGNTHIWISLTEGRTRPMLGCCPNGTVTVDWGDGTEPDVLNGTSESATKWTPTHEYAAPGDYVITLTVDGTMAFYGNSSANQYSGILRYASSGDTRNRAYQNAVQKVEIGSGVTSIGGYTFNNCYSLASIAIPDSVTSIGTRAFNSCYSLASIAIPGSVTSIDSYTFSNCQSLASIAIPDSVTSIDSYAFNSCHSLASIAIPDSVTSIGTYAFNSCYGVRYYDFTSHTAVPTLYNTDAFTGIPADCEIRVPAALYDEWIAATNWSTYASNIVAV